MGAGGRNLFDDRKLESCFRTYVPSFPLFSCQKEKIARYGRGFKTSCEDRDKEISERDWADPRQNIHAHPSIPQTLLTLFEGFFLFEAAFSK